MSSSKRGANNVLAAGWSVHPNNDPQPDVILSGKGPFIDNRRRGSGKKQDTTDEVPAERKGRSGKVVLKKKKPAEE